MLEGALKCPNCSRIYEIKNGIPNMLLDETEVWFALISVFNPFKNIQSLINVNVSVFADSRLVI